MQGWTKRFIFFHFWLYLACVGAVWGFNCAIDCLCVPENTASCNNVDGSCTCLPGWEGSDCELNINECSLETASCPDNSDCVDTDGSYDCVCHDGFRGQPDNTCTGKIRLILNYSHIVTKTTPKQTFYFKLTIDVTVIRKIHETSCSSVHLSSEYVNMFYRLK
jgi:hypothetical protein